MKKPLTPDGVREALTVRDGQGPVAAVAELVDADAVVGGEDGGAHLVEDVVERDAAGWLVGAEAVQDAVTESAGELWGPGGHKKE